jgi:hypothetical protein
VEPRFNYLAILVASLSGFVLGALWYGPLFGKAWMRLSGTTEAEVKDTNFVKVYGLTFVMNLIAAYVMAHVLWAFSVAMPEVSGVMAGIQGGFWTWLGFIMTVMVSNALFSKTSQKLTWLDLGYRLLWIVAIAIIIAVWK